jgi:hypothetical protein
VSDEIVRLRGRASGLAPTRSVETSGAIHQMGPDKVVSLTPLVRP